MGWSRQDLTPNDAQAGLDFGRDPDHDVEHGPVERVLALSNPAQVWAVHDVLHAWRLAQGRERQAHQARALLCGRFLRACWWREVRPHLLPAMAALRPGEPGILSHYLRTLRLSLTPVDMQDRDVLNRILTEPHWAPLCDHEGLGSMAEGWAMMGWLGTGDGLSTGSPVAFATPAVRSSVVDLFKGWARSFDDAGVMAQMGHLAQWMEPQWRALLSQAPARRSTREVVAATGWLFGLNLLGRDLTHALDLGPRILLGHPAWATGFDLVRQTYAHTAQLADTCETVLSLRGQAEIPAEAMDAFLWRALPLPSLLGGSTDALREQMEEQWVALLNRHPTWTAERPLPPRLMSALDDSPSLLAHWRAALGHAGPDRQRPRLRS